MSEEQTNQTSDTNNAEAPLQEAAHTMPGESSSSVDISGAPGASVASSDANASAPSSAPVESTQQSSTDLGNAPSASSTVGADAGSGLQSSAPVNTTDVDPNVVLRTTAHQWTPEQLAQIQAIGAAPVQMQSSFDSALSAAGLQENAMQSYAAAVQQSGVTLATSAFASLAGEAKRSIQRLRDHLWTFEHSAVAHLHAELDKLESFFR